MKRTPEEERIPKHEAVLVDTEHSYRQYKGTYYCRK